MRGIVAKRLRHSAEEATAGMPFVRYEVKDYGTKAIPYIVNGAVRYFQVPRRTVRLGECTRRVYQRLKAGRRGPEIVKRGG